jgi:hypothetical protein
VRLPLRVRPLGLLVGAALVFASSSAGRPTADVRWRQLAHVIGVVDVAGPRADGRFVVASQKGLFLLRRDGTTTPFARGVDGYVAPPGEAYIALGRTKRVPGAGCSFRRDDVYALEPGANPGVVLIERTGRARRFVNFPSGGFPSSIAFDTVGRFGFRLLVTVLTSNQTKTTLYAIDCAGRARVVASGAPKVEGGAQVAPKTFGAFGGRLVAADEFNGRVYAFNARGRVRVLARPNLPRGQDLGVESLGFVPATFTRRGAAYFSDLGAPGSPTQGTDSVLVLSGRELFAARVRRGDLLVATEAGGITLSIRCRRGCVSRRIGRAFDATHGEGHIPFLPR